MIPPLTVPQLASNGVPAGPLTRWVVEPKLDGSPNSRHVCQSPTQPLQVVQVLSLENHALRRSAGHDATVVPLSGAELGP